MQSDWSKVRLCFHCILVYLTFQAIGSGKNVRNSEEASVGQRLALELRLLGSHWRT
jgi:hypothetical protein